MFIWHLLAVFYLYGVDGGLLYCVIIAVIALGSRFGKLKGGIQIKVINK